MKIIGSIIVFCLSCWGLISLFFFPEAASEVFWGMLAPLTIGVVTILMVRRICSTQSRKLTRFMTRAFLGKMVIYGIYVVVILGLYSLRPVPFIISFAGFFTALHFVEALYFRRLFASTGQLGPEEDR